MKSALAVILLLAASAVSAQQWEWVNPLPTGNALDAVAAFSDSRCMVFGGQNTILLTTDGGQHWSVSGAHAGSSFYDASFTDSLHGWLAGGNGT